VSVREHPAAKEAGWALAAALLQVREREGESTRRPRRPGGRWRWRCCR
jgi:predicted NodU family carbamoyl transferase